MDDAHVLVKLSSAANGRARVTVSLTLRDPRMEPSFRRLCGALATWSGRPVLVELPAGGRSAAWFNEWAGAAVDVPEEVLELHVTLAREAR
jgi:hypothetical protein